MLPLALTLTFALLAHHGVYRDISRMANEIAMLRPYFIIAMS